MEGPREVGSGGASPERPRSAASRPPLSWGGQQAFLGTCFQTRFSRVWLPFGVFVEVATADVQILTGTLFLLTMGLVQGGLGLWR